MSRSRRTAWLAGGVAALGLFSFAEASGQEVTPPDSAAADSLAPGAAADSLTLEELEAKLMGELGAVDSTAAAPGGEPATPRTPATLLPDISVIADLLTDLSPDGSTIEEGDRFQLREIELGLQGSVDPYFRYDAFLAFHGEALEIEEGYATTLALPAGLQVKAGKFLLPFGKVNLTHRPELHTIDYPLYIQAYFGEEGLSSTGVRASWIGAPLGIFQELSLAATNGAEPHAREEGEEEPEEDERAGEAKDLFDDLADRLWVAHLKNSFDLTPASNLEVGASWGTSATDDPERARTTLWGLDAIWRWKPLALARYRSVILQAEAAWREQPGPAEERFGAFVFGQVQLTPRVHLGGRYDVLEPPDPEAGTVHAGQAVLRYFPTEFSQLRLAYERQAPEGEDAIDRLLFQLTFALGPHRPHAY
ncbi:MAG: hypothetical protein ACREMK_07060 [Gemmatimonadota bacterium]